MKILFQNSLYVFSLLGETNPILLFEWTDKTAQMSYEDFQEACHNYAGFAWQYQTKHLLVDTCLFHYQLPKNYTEWREESLNPRYYSLEVEKFAYLTKQEFIAYMQDIPAENGQFATRNFVKMADALAWLNQKEI